MVSQLVEVDRLWKRSLRPEKERRWKRLLWWAWTLQRGAQVAMMLAIETVLSGTEQVGRMEKMRKVVWRCPLLRLGTLIF